MMKKKKKKRKGYINRRRGLYWPMITKKIGEGPLYKFEVEVSQMILAKL